MRTFAALLLTLALSGCASIMDLIPSFNDPNQSASIVNVQQSIENIDCQKDQLPQARNVQQQLQWFELYSRSKGRQNDVLRIVEPMHETVSDWVKRSEDKQGTEAYCKIKKKILQQQSATAAKAVLGRF